MIWPTDAARLAYTKLKTRKVRLIVTVVISGLLFTGLFTASFVVRGVISSIESYSKEGFAGRYIVSGSPIEAQFVDPTDQALIKRAEEIRKQTIADKKAEAKKLGLEYDSESEPLVSSTDPGGAKFLDMSSSAAKQAIKEKNGAAKNGSLEDLQKIAKPYSATASYRTESMGSGTAGGYALQVLKDGKEDFYKEEKGNKGQFQQQTGTDGFTNSWKLMSKDLLKPFTLNGQSLEVKDGAIPIVVPFSAAEQIVQLKALPSTAKPAEKLARLKEVRQKAAGVTFQACYRNQSSIERVEKAKQIQAELKQNENKKDYVKPSLIYDLPAEPCGDVRVVKDTRTAEEKKRDTNQELFDQKFGKSPAESQMFTLRVAGVNADLPTGSASAVEQIITSLVTSNIGDGWMSPQELKTDNAVMQKVFTSDPGDNNAVLLSQYFVEFPGPQQAREFLDKANCTPSISFGDIANPEASDPFKTCREQGKLFFLTPFGSSSLAIDQFKQGFGQVFRIITFIVAGIAALIMVGTVGRIIADSRRETAVFRAIGAKRLDIMQIYLTYSLYLAIIIALFASLSAALIANWISSRYTDEATVVATLAYNAQDLTRSFNMFAVYGRDMLFVGGIILAAALIAALLPLATNVRRNPINDMRDER